MSLVLSAEAPTALSVGNAPCRSGTSHWQRCVSPELCAYVAPASKGDGDMIRKVFGCLVEQTRAGQVIKTAYISIVLPKIRVCPTIRRLGLRTEIASEALGTFMSVEAGLSSSLRG